MYLQKTACYEILHKACDVQLPGQTGPLLSYGTPGKLSTAGSSCQYPITMTKPGKQAIDAGQIPMKASNTTQSKPAITALQKKKNLYVAPPTSVGMMTCVL